MKRLRNQKMSREIPRYDFKIEWSGSYYSDVPGIKSIESLTGEYCLAYHMDELEDEIFKLRVKYNDWEKV